MGGLDQLLWVETPGVAGTPGWLPLAAGFVPSNMGCPWVVTATMGIGTGGDTEWLLPPWVVLIAHSSLTGRCGPSLVFSQVAPGPGSASGGR